MKQIHVVAAIIIKDEKILCTQRGTGSLAYKWEFPGGKIEAGETEQEALKREIKEELHCDIEIGEKAAHTIHTYDFGTVHLTTYYCELMKEEPILTEHIAMKWLYPDDLMSLEWAPADIPAVEKVRA